VLINKKMLAIIRKASLGPIALANRQIKPIILHAVPIASEIISYPVAGDPSISAERSGKQPSGKLHF
jgi:hypothetical protein